MTSDPLKSKIERLQKMSAPPPIVMPRPAQWTCIYLLSFACVLNAATLFFLAVFR